jgi:hypothetical protein
MPALGVQKSPAALRHLESGTRPHAAPLSTLPDYVERYRIGEALYLKKSGHGVDAVNVSLDIVFWGLQAVEEAE